MRRSFNELVKTGGRLIKHARYYWLLLTESHPDAAAVWRHAEQDCDAACASRIGGPRSAADFDDEMGGRRSVCEIDWKNGILGVAWPPDAKPTVVRKNSTTSCSTGQEAVLVVKSVQDGVHHNSA